MKTKNINLLIKHSKVKELISYLKDLIAIGQDIRLRIDKNDTLFYSMNALNIKTIQAMKFFILKTDDYIDYSDDDLDIDVVITKARTFIKNLELIVENNEPNADTKLTFSYKESGKVFLAEKILLSNKKIKINWILGDLNILKNVNSKTLNLMINSEKRWIFKVDLENFLNIKKLSTINALTDDKLIKFSLNNGNVYASDPLENWKTLITTYDKDECDDSETSIIIDTKFFSSLKQQDVITFNLINNSVLIEQDNMKLFISTHQTI